ncbi:MAG: hypothetical protein VW268_04275 [Rhodospirillaceae bacterium]
MAIQQTYGTMIGNARRIKANSSRRHVLGVARSVAGSGGTSAVVDSGVMVFVDVGVGMKLVELDDGFRTKKADLAVCPGTGRQITAKLGR